MRLVMSGIFLGVFSSFLDFIVGEFFSVAVSVLGGTKLCCWVILCNFALKKLVVIEFLSDDGAVIVSNKSHGTRNLSGGGRFCLWLEENLGADRRESCWLRLRMLWRSLIALVNSALV